MIENEKNYFLDLLKKLVAYESVSTDKNRHKHIVATADFVKKKLEKCGFLVDLYSHDNCSPLLVAKKIISPKAKTIGVYAHYDVQPEDPISQWRSPPFDITEKNGKIFGRGVADDKGHLAQAITAAKYLIAENKLTNNLVFIFEGEEEVESKNFAYLIERHRREIGKIDVFYVLDMGMRDKNIPQLFYGLRGAVAMELTVKIGESDLHSGVYGNQVINPAQVVSELMAKIKDSKSGKITIPGFYEKVKKISDEEVRLLKKIPYDDKKEKQDAQVFSFVGDRLDSKIKPSFDINGIYSGYVKEGFKTIIPAKATVKFSFRLVENQTAEDISTKVKKFIVDNLPKGIKYEIKEFGGADPFITNFDDNFNQKTAEILAETFGHETYFNRSGGSVPAAEILKRAFKNPSVLIGFTLPDENIHAPQENIDAEMFFKGITALKKIFCQ